MTSRKRINKLRKLFGNKSRNSKKSRKNRNSLKIQIAGGKEELLKKRNELIDQLSKLRETDITNPNEHNDMRMRFTREEIEKIEFQLKTPEEQQAILEQRRIASVAFKQRQKELEEQREKNRKELEEKQLEQERADQESLKRFNAQSYEKSKQNIKEWEQQNLSRLQGDKLFVQSELQRLHTQYENITAQGQPRGAAAFPDYPIWYKLMVELLNKYR
jgi:hypothetical protein